MKLVTIQRMFASVVAVSLVMCASRSMAASYYSSPDQQPVTCLTPETAIQAAQLLRSHASQETVAPIFQAGNCLIRAEGTRFEIVEQHGDYSQVRFPGSSSNEPRYIAGDIASLKGPFDKIRDQKVYPPGCREPGGGEVDRMEVGPNGQMFLKRYFITEKCVNGQMRSFTKRLN